MLPPDEQKRAESRMKTLRKRFESAQEVLDMHALMSSMAANRESVVVGGNYILSRARFSWLSPLGD